VTNFSAVRRALILTMLLNYAAAAIKLTTGLLTGSLSILADSLGTLFDGASNIIGLAGIYIARRPPDKEHPYGHRKYETMATLGIAFLLFLTCWELIRNAISRLSNPVQPAINPWVAVAVVASIAIQALTSWYEEGVGRALKSEVLIADALYTRSSILVSAVVLVGLALIRAGHAWVDPVLALLIAAIIARIGIGIVWDAAQVLGDRAPLDAEKIEDAAMSIEGVEFVHRIRSRGTADDIAIDLHIHVAPHSSIDSANAVADAVQAKLMSEFEGVHDVTVHAEPRTPPPNTEPDLFPTLRQIAGHYPVTVHEMWAREVEGKLYVEMDVGVDRELTLEQAHDLVSRIEQDGRARLPSVASVHTHIEFASDEVARGKAAPQRLVVRVRREVEELTRAIPAVQECHGLRVQEFDDRIFIALHCTVAADLSLEQAHEVASQVEDWLRQRLPDIGGVAVHVEPPGAVDV
jgi:cation diffusion facilitator family transporter